MHPVLRYLSSKSNSILVDKRTRPMVFIKELDEFLGMSSNTAFEFMVVDRASLIGNKVIESFLDLLLSFLSTDN